MRNTLLALALASVFNSVVAREASFYGVADMYIAINNDSGHISTDVQSGGTNASLIGLEGKETLSSDLSAIFRLEAGVLMDDGTSYHHRFHANTCETFASEGQSRSWRSRYRSSL